MTVLELPQGHGWKSYEGKTLDEAVTQLRQWDEDFIVQLLPKLPNIRQTHRPSWVKLEVPDTATAPWGTEWYRVGEDGRLFLHSADYDSSD